MAHKNGRSLASVGFLRRNKTLEHIRLANRKHFWFADHKNMHAIIWIVLIRCIQWWFYCCHMAIKSEHEHLLACVVFSVWTQFGSDLRWNGPHYRNICLVRSFCCRIEIHLVLSYDRSQSVCLGPLKSNTSIDFETWIELLHRNNENKTEKAQIGEKAHDTQQTKIPFYNDSMIRATNQCFIASFQMQPIQNNRRTEIKL